jgi:hypothetical protein
VVINGVALASDRIGKPVAVMPGTVTIVASTGSGDASQTRKLTLNGGQLETLTLSFGDDAGGDDSPVAAGGQRAGPDADEGADQGADQGTASGGELRIVGYGVAGLGVAGMVMFGVARAAADAKFDEVSAACGSSRCTDPAFAGDIDDGKTLDTLTNVGLVVGLLGLSAGAALIVFGGPSESGSGQAMSLDVGPTSLRLRGSF